MQTSDEALALGGDNTGIVCVLIRYFYPYTHVLYACILIKTCHIRDVHIIQLVSTYFLYVYI